MSAHHLEKLAAALGRPSASLSAFAHLSPEQLALLADAVEATRVRRRRELADALARTIPAAPARRAVLSALRRAPR